MTHTPAPWIVGTPPPNGEQTIGTKNGLMIAVATAGVGLDALANACLIAAAPDLLAALENMVAWNGKRGGDDDALLPADQQDKEVAQAMRAIAKANGGKV